MRTTIDIENAKPLGRKRMVIIRDMVVQQIFLMSRR